MIEMIEPVDLQDRASEFVLEAIANLLGVVHGLRLARGDQCGGKKRFAMQRQKLEQGFVLWHPQSNSFALRMAHTSRDFFGGL